MQETFLASSLCPEDGGSRFLSNAGNYLQNFIVSYPRIMQSSGSL
jgi:hypothetical protein